MKVFPITCAISAVMIHVVMAAEVPTKDGMLLWLKADEGVVCDDSGRVKEWADQSGQGWSVSQPDAERRPALAASAMNGKAAIQFESSKTVLSTEPLPPPAQFSVFMVVNLNDQKYSQLIQCAPSGGEPATSVFNFMSGPKDGNGLYIYGDGSIVEITTGGQDLPLNWLESGTVVMAEVIADGYAGSTMLLRNGEVLGTSDAPFGNLRGAGQPRPLHIGGTTGGFPSGNGLIAEVLIYEAALSAEERQRVEKYLSEKYGITLAQ